MFLDEVKSPSTEKDALSTASGQERRRSRGGGWQSLLWSGYEEGSDLADRAWNHRCQNYLTMIASLPGIQVSLTDVGYARHYCESGKMWLSLDRGMLADLRLAVGEYHHFGSATDAGAQMLAFAGLVLQMFSVP